MMGHVCAPRPKHRNSKSTLKRLAAEGDARRLIPKPNGKALPQTTISGAKLDEYHASNDANEGEDNEDQSVARVGERKHGRAGDRSVGATGGVHVV